MKNRLIIFTIALLLTTIFCNAQKNEIDYNMEKYDFELVKKFKYNTIGIVHNDRKIVINRMGGSGAQIHEYLPVPNFYKIIKAFYPNGNLKAIEKEVGVNLAIGETIVYDEQGAVIKRINEDEKFGKIKIEDLLKFIEKEGYIDIDTGLGFENVEIKDDGQVQIIPSKFKISNRIANNQYWNIIIIAQPWNNWTEIIYHLDKDTGEVLFKESKKKYPIM